MDNFIKTIGKAEKCFCFLVGLFWLSETFYFILKMGWHLKANTDAEKYCDGLVSRGVEVWFNFFISVAAIKIIYFFSKKP